MTSFAHVNLLLEIILKTYFFNARCILIFTESAKPLNIITKIPTVYVNVHKQLNPELIFRHHGCQDIIIYDKNQSAIFREFEKLIRLQNERFNSRRYIILEDSFLEVITSKELSYISDFLFITPSYDLLTYFLGDLKATLLDKWFPANRSFLHNRNLFPNKFKDLRGYPLKIGAFNYEPYSIVSENNETFKGTEANLVLEFVRKLNFTPVFVKIGEDLWGDIYKNWTGVGILGSLLDDKVDIGYSAIYMWEEYYNYLDYTKPLTRTGVTCLVPAPKLAAGWFTPLHSFSVKMWAALLGNFTLSVLTLTFMLKKYKKIIKNDFETALLTMTKMYLLQSITGKATGFFMKYFLALNLIYVLLISSCYSSGLSSVMTIPRYEKSINTVADLAESGLSWGATSDAWLISIKQVTEENYVKIKNKMIVANEENLEMAARLNNLGFSIERLPYDHYAVGPYIKNDTISNYRIMQEDIYWEQCIFMLRKNSVLLAQLDNLILRVIEAGLGANWENQVVAENMDMSVQRGIKYYTHRIRDHPIVKLKWMHVQGTFSILLLGYIMSALVFAIEILSQKTSESIIVKIDH